MFTADGTIGNLSHPFYSKEEMICAMTSVSTPVDVAAENGGLSHVNKGQAERGSGRLVLFDDILSIR